MDIKLQSTKTSIGDNKSIQILPLNIHKPQRTLNTRLCTITSVEHPSSIESNLKK